MRNRVIYKYTMITAPGRQLLDMPKGARILHAGLQYHQLRLWALVDTTAEMETREFLLLETGADATEAEKAAAYYGTFMLLCETYVLHLFEVPHAA